MSENKLKYVTMDGVEIPFRPMSPIIFERAANNLRQAYIDRGDVLDPPTYTVETAGGGSQTFAHDEESVKGKPEMEMAWAAYLDVNKRLKDELSELRGSIVLDCVLLEMPEHGAWEDKQRKWGIVISDEPDEKRRQWLETEVMRSMQDIFNFADVVLRASYAGVVDEATIDAASRTFRGKMANKKQPDGS